MSDPELPLFALRLIIASAALLIGLLAGEPIGKLLQLPRLLTLLAFATRRLGEKLNKRDVATRAWRGMIVLGMLLLPTVALGVMMGPHPLLQGALLALTVGLAATPYTTIGAALRLGQGKLTLQSDASGFLFSDTHGLLRHSVLGQSTAVAVGIIGAGFWYVIGGMAACGAYLVLALASAHYTPELAKNLAFGTPARILFRAADIVPRTLHHFLLLVAGCIIPGAHPVKAGRHFFGNGPAFVASLLDVALGGRMPTAAGTRKLDWVGGGTARLDARHLTRWLLLLGVSLLLWLLLLLILLQAFVM